MSAATTLLDGGAGNDIMIGDGSTIRGTGRGGNDTMLGGDGDDRMYGDAYTGFFTVPPGGRSFRTPASPISPRAATTIIDGGNGNDTIVGDALNFSSFRFGGDPHGSGGADTLIGGNGDDLLIGDARTHMPRSERPRPPAATTACSAARATTGCSATSMGSDGGRGGNDRLFGDAGDDELHSGGGAFDIMDGGEGVDTVVFDGNRADFGSRGTARTARVPRGRRSRPASTDLLTNVEFLAFLDMTIQAGQIL